MACMYYPNIDMVKTGQLIRYYVFRQSYTVRELQKELALGSPQPIYRWFQGKILPSVDHLLRLSQLLEVHMETLLVQQRKCHIKRVCHTDEEECARLERLWLYYEIFYSNINKI